MPHFPGTYEDEIGSTERITDYTEPSLLSDSMTLESGSGSPSRTGESALVAWEARKRAQCIGSQHFPRSRCDWAPGMDWEDMIHGGLPDQNWLSSVDALRALNCLSWGGVSVNWPHSGVPDRTGIRGIRKRVRPRIRSYCSGHTF